MASWAGSPHQPPRKREAAGRVLPFAVLCALVVAAVLVVAALLLKVDRVKLGTTGAGEPSNGQSAHVQRATDAAGEVSFRLLSTKVTVSAGRDAPALPDLPGRTITVQCAFLADQGAVLTEGRVRWPHGDRKVTATLQQRARAVPRSSAVSSARTAGRRSRRRCSRPCAARRTCRADPKNTASTRARGARR